MKNNKKEFAKYIENYMLIHDYKLEYIAEKIGVSISAIGHYKTGVRTPKDDFIDSFIKAFRLNEEETKKIKLAVAIDRTPDIIKEKYMKSNVNLPPSDTLISLPIRAVASAGTGKINFDEEPKKYITVKKNGFNEHCYLIEVSGDSMYPTIPDGALAVVDPYQKDYIEDKVYVVNYNDNLYIKKVLYKEKENIIILQSVNRSYEDIYIIGEDIENLKIIGRVVKYMLETTL